jgi:hypothetical protein
MRRRNDHARRHRPVPRTTRARRARLSPRQYEAKVRGLAAINRVRRGKSRTLSSAARAEGTTVRSIGKLLPAALLQGAPGERIRVKAGDPYSARVEIVTDSGPLDVNARGSRERELAALHRATVIAVLRGDESPSALEKFRNKTVGSQKLASDFDRLEEIAQGGDLDQLEALYVSPETRS